MFFGWMCVSFSALSLCWRSSLVEEDLWIEIHGRCRDTAYSFINLLPLLFGQPIQRIRILRRTMRLHGSSLSNRLLLLLLLLRALRNPEISGR